LLKLPSSSTSVRDIWGSSPTSICGGLCTASRGTCPMFLGTWWVGLPSRCARGVSTRLRAPRHQQGVGAGLVCCVEPGALPPGVHRPCTGIQGMLGGAADHRGGGAGGAPPQGDRWSDSPEADRGRGGPLYLQAADAADTGEGPTSLRVLGSRGPDPGTETQGLPGRNCKPGRPHHGGADPGQGLPKSPLPEAADQRRKFS